MDNMILSYTSESDQGKLDTLLKKILGKLVIREQITEFCKTDMTRLIILVCAYHGNYQPRINLGLDELGVSYNDHCLYLGARRLQSH